MRITREMLQGACEDQVDLFFKTFPDGAEVTLENCLKSASAGLDISWAAERFLTAPAKAEYQKATVTALAEYQKATDPAWAEYEKAKATAWAEYQKATAPAWAEYQKATAPAFYELFSDPKNRR